MNTSSLYAFINSLIGKFARIKTIIWYQHFFGKIGFKSTIFKPQRLLNPQNIIIGNFVRIYRDARIETITRWGTEEFSPKISIGDRTTFEQRLHIICASRIIIGKDVVFSADIMITDINHEYRNINTNVLQQPLEVKEVEIGDYCFIGMGARILPGTKLGNNCIVGTNSVVLGIFPDNSVIVGSPAKIVKQYDIEKKIWIRTNSGGVSN